MSISEQLFSGWSLFAWFGIPSKVAANLIIASVIAIWISRDTFKPFSKAYKVWLIVLISGILFQVGQSIRILADPGWATQSAALAFVGIYWLRWIIINSLFIAFPQIGAFYAANYIANALRVQPMYSGTEKYYLYIFVFLTLPMIFLSTVIYTELAIIFNATPD